MRYDHYKGSLGVVRVKREKHDVDASPYYHKSAILVFKVTVGLWGRVASLTVNAQRSGRRAPITAHRWWQIGHHGRSSFLREIGQHQNKSKKKVTWNLKK